MRNREAKAMIAVKSLPKDVITNLQSPERCAPLRENVSTPNLEAWFSTPNIVDIDEMLIGI